MRLLKCTTGLSRGNIKSLLPKIILSQFVAAGWLVFTCAVWHAMWAALHHTWAVTSRGQRNMPGVSHVDCRAHSRLLSHAKTATLPPAMGHHCQQRRKGKGTNTPGPAAQHRPCRRRLPAAASSWDGRHGGTMSVCQEVLGSLPPLLCASSGCPLTHPNPAFGRATSPASSPLAKARGSRMWARFLLQLSSCLPWLHSDLALLFRL